VARVSYFAIEQAIKAVLDAEDSLQNVEVLLESPLTFNEGLHVIIYLDSREAPASLQSLSAGQRTRYLVSISIWCFAFGLELLDALAARDELVSNVEIALMRDRTFGDVVTTSWMTGGEFQTIPQNAGFMVGAETRVIVDVQADIQGVPSG